MRRLFCGDRVYFLVSNQWVVEATLKAWRDGRCVIVYDHGRGRICLSRSRLFGTAEEAQRSKRIHPPPRAGPGASPRALRNAPVDEPGDGWYRG